MKSIFLEFFIISSNGGLEESTRMWPKFFEPLSKFDSWSFSISLTFDCLPSCSIRFFDCRVIWFEYYLISFVPAWIWSIYLDNPMLSSSQAFFASSFSSPTVECCLPLSYTLRVISAHTFSNGVASEEMASHASLEFLHVKVILWLTC